MNRSEMMVTRAARNIQKRIPQIWKEMEPDLTDDYWGAMGEWGDMIKAQRDRVYNFESRVFDEMGQKIEKFDKSEQQKLYKLADLMLKKFLKSPAAKHPTKRLNQRPAGTSRYFPSLDGKKNPVKSRKGWKIQIVSSNGWADVKSGNGGNYKTDYYSTKNDAQSEVAELAEIHGDFDSFRVVPASTKADDDIYENPVKPRKGEPSRKFVSRCMSEEKKSFPKQKQRISICLSKAQARRNPFNDRNLDA